MTSSGVGLYQVIITLVVIATVSVRCQQAAECSSSSIKACMNQQAPFLPSLPTTWTADDYDTFCRKAELFRACVDKLPCTPSDAQLYSHYLRSVGITYGDEYLCSAAVRSVYLANQACVAGRLSLTSLFCRNVSIPANYAALSPTDQCRLQRRFYGCVYTGLTSGCNEDIAETVVNFNVRKYSPSLLATTNCNLTVEYSVEEPVNIDGNCSVESVTQCRNLVSQSPDFTAGNIDQLCQQTTEFASCVDNLRCPTNHSLYFDVRQLTGVRDGYVYMCSDKVKPVIKDNAACIKSALASLQSVNRAGDTDVKAICRSYNAHVENVFKSVKSRCGGKSDVASVVTTMTLKRLMPLINTITDCRLTEGNAGCKLVDIYDCITEQAAFSASLPKTWTDDDYSAFCNETKKLKSCTDALSCSATDRLYVIHQHLVGISVGDQYLCSDAARPVFLANQACFASKLQSIAATCHLSSFSTASTSPASESDLCRSHNKHYECVYKALKNECNEATARVVVEFNVDKQQPELRASINCQLDTSSYLSTSSNSASSLSIVTAVQLLMIGVCAYF